MQNGSESEPKNLCYKNRENFIDHHIRSKGWSRQKSDTEWALLYVNYCTSRKVPATCDLCCKKFHPKEIGIQPDGFITCPECHYEEFRKW